MVDDTVDSTAMLIRLMAESIALELGQMLMEQDLGDVQGNLKSLDPEQSHLIGIMIMFRYTGRFVRWGVVPLLVTPKALKIPEIFPITYRTLIWQRASQLKFEARDFGDFHVEHYFRWGRSWNEVPVVPSETWLVDWGLLLEGDNSKHVLFLHIYLRGIVATS